MNLIDAYRQILRNCIQPESSVEDIVWCGLVLHTHAIALRPEIEIEDVARAPGRGAVLGPLTRTHVAELTASLWPERGDEAYWFAESRRVTPYEIFDDIPQNLRDRAIAGRARIEAQSQIETLIEE